MTSVALNQVRGGFGVVHTAESARELPAPGSPIGEGVRLTERPRLGHRAPAPLRNGPTNHSRTGTTGRQAHGSTVAEDTTTIPGTLIERESGQLLLMKIPGS